MKTRKFLAIFSCFLISSALARSDFEKAEILERKGEILEALKIYKRLAQGALEESRGEVKSENLSSEAKPKQTEISAAGSENFLKFSRFLLQILRAFGIFTLAVVPRPGSLSKLISPPKR